MNTTHNRKYRISQMEELRSKFENRRNFFKKFFFGITLPGYSKTWTLIYLAGCIIFLLTYLFYIGFNTTFYYLSILLVLSGLFSYLDFRKKN